MDCCRPVGDLWCIFATAVEPGKIGFRNVPTFGISADHGTRYLPGAILFQGGEPGARLPLLPGSRQEEPGRKI